MQCCQEYCIVLDKMRNFFPIRQRFAFLLHILKKKKATFPGSLQCLYKKYYLLTITCFVITISLLIAFTK